MNAQRYICTRRVKRNGKEHPAGTEIELSPDEVAAAPAGLYALPGAAPDPVQEERDAAAARNAEHQRLKAARVEAQRIAAEDAAKRRLADIEKQKQMAEAATARATTRRRQQERA